MSCTKGTLKYQLLKQLLENWKNTRSSPFTWAQWKTSPTEAQMVLKHVRKQPRNTGGNWSITWRNGVYLHFSSTLIKTQVLHIHNRTDDAMESSNQTTKNLQPSDQRFTALYLDQSRHKKSWDHKGYYSNTWCCPAHTQDHVKLSLMIQRRIVRRSWSNETNRELFRGC